MSAPVFISYSSKDEEAALTICAELESRQLNCWIAVRDVDPGENFQEAIVRAIRSAKVMVLVFTKNANNSEEIKNEVALASQRQLVVIPVRVDDVGPNDALAYALATRQWIDLFRDWKGAIDRLASRIRAIVSVESGVIPDGNARTAEQPNSVLPEAPNKSRPPDLAEGPVAAVEKPKEPESRRQNGDPPQRKKHTGTLTGDIITGIIGAIIAGWLLPRLGIFMGGAIVGQIIIAVIGAVILLVIVGLIRRQRGQRLSGGVGSSRVDLQACKLEYSIVSPK